MSVRGRPRSFDRDVALQRAMEVFWTKGYEGAQLVDLTTAMGLNPPSFYAAFGSKQAIFREAVDLYLATAGSGTMRALETATDTRKAIEAMLLASAEIALTSSSGGCLLVLGLVNALPENEEVKQYLAALRRATVERIGERLERGVREGDLPPGTNISGLATFYAAVIQGLSMQARDGADREDLLNVIAAAMSALGSAA